MDIEEQYRAFLIKLGHVTTTIGELPSECSFTLTIELMDKVQIPLSYNSTWIVTEDQNTETKELNVGSSNRIKPKIRPLRNIVVGPIGFDIWLEESATKDKLIPS